MVYGIGNLTDLLIVNGGAKEINIVSFQLMWSFAPMGFSLDELRSLGIT